MKYDIISSYWYKKIISSRSKTINLPATSHKMKLVDKRSEEKMGIFEDHKLKEQFCSRTASENRTQTMSKITIFTLDTSVLLSGVNDDNRYRDFNCFTLN